MDRRTLLALVLTAIVIVATPMLFSGRSRAPRTPAADTTPVTRGATTAAAAPSAPATIGAPPATSGAPAPPAAATPSARAETTVVRTGRAVFSIVSPGGTPAAVELPEYRSLRPGSARGTPVRMLETGDRLFRLRLASGADTLVLDTVAFRAEPRRLDRGWIVQPFASTSASTPVSLTYRFHPDSFLVRVEGRLGAAVPGTARRELLVALPLRIRSEEADVVDDTRHLAIAYRKRSSEVDNVSYRDLDTLVSRVDTGGIRWVAERNKYFVVALIPAGSDSAFRALGIQGGARIGREPTAAHATAVLPLTGDAFSFGVYAGPQSWNHLRRTAVDLENVNPYGGWLHNVVQPFATIVMRMLLWMRATVDVGYGWVLVIFGILVRLLLWPLNQNAMRSSMKMQRLQPELAEIQKKYRDNPERQRDAMLKLYQQHGMSPFTPVLGCLPMLLPMPILFALYFVFQNTIELRGVPFLWLPDLALKDPLYVTPLFMGASMFLLSWIGMRGMPPSPQGKMMSYVMPVMFTVLFWNFASGLNLYYAVQNVAALPQQWLLSRERASQAATPPKGTKRDKT